MNWPTVIVDDFFEHPDDILKEAKKQKYIKGTKYPGYRSGPLHVSNHNLFNYINKKVLAVLYPNNHTSLFYESSVEFCKVPNNMPSDGWVHHDRAQITFIIYLNKDIDIGTSIFKRSKPGATDIHYEKKQSYFLRPSLNVTKQRQENNDQFIETASIKGIYNRLIMFDCKQFHAAHINNTDFERYTLLGFMHKIWDQNTMLSYPIPESKRI